MSRYRKPTEPTVEERAWLDSKPRPHLLLMIGRPIRYWKVSPGHVALLVRALLERTQRLGGSLIVTGSPRTPSDVIARARQELAAAGNGRLAGKIEEPMAGKIVNPVEIAAEQVRGLFKTSD